MCVQCIYCLSMYSTLATPIKRPLLSRSGPPLLPATQQHCSVEEEHNSKAVSQSWRQLMGVHNSHTYNPRHTQTPCCTATPVAVCLSVLLAEGPTWVDGSISLDAPWNCGPQCAAITRHTRGTHTHTQSSTRRHSRAAIAVGSCCNQTSKRLGKGRNTCAFCHSSCVPPLCLGHTAASGLPTTHSSSCVHSHPPTANSMATQPRLSCGQPTPAASGCVCVFV